MMKMAMLGLLAETPIHPGAGRSMGVVDLPVAREAATDYPRVGGIEPERCIAGQDGDRRGQRVMQETVLAHRTMLATSSCPTHACCCFRCVA